MTIPGLPALERLLARIEVDADTGCWLWTGYVHRPSGRGRAWFNGEARGVHQITFTLLVGEVPEGLELDHLCNVKLCCNPDHLEPVTHAENMRRRADRQTHCKWGHPRTVDNIYVRYEPRRTRVICKTCVREWAYKFNGRKVA